MKHYDVVISDKAREDMEAIHRYISDTLLEPDIAVKQYDRIADAILTLEQLPERIRIMDSEPERTRELRPLIVGNYTVFFVINDVDDTVNVARVLYSSSNISKRLAEE